MTTHSRLAQWLMVLCLASLTACGGSSDNVSPGREVIPPEGGNGGDGGDGGDQGGDTTASVIPAALEDAIRPSGETAADGREIYDIDVTALPGGRLDPAGLLLGNDVIFRITGGALRVSDQG